MSCKCIGISMFMALPTQTPARCCAGAGGGIRTPDRLITNQLLYRTELRQPDKNGSVARPVPRGQARVDTNSFRRRTARLRGWIPPLSSKMRRGFLRDGPAAPRPSRDPRLPSPPSGRLRDLRGRRSRSAAAARPSRHRARGRVRSGPPHGDLAWRVHDGLPVVEVVNNWTYRRGSHRLGSAPAT